MNVQVRDLKAHLSHYLRLIQQGETVVVTVHNKPVARLEPVAAGCEDLPEIPGLSWAAGKPRLIRSSQERPTIEGDTLAAWIVENRG